MHINIIEPWCKNESVIFQEFKLYNSVYDKLCKSLWFLFIFSLMLLPNMPFCKNAYFFLSDLILSKYFRYIFNNLFFLTVGFAAKLTYSIDCTQSIQIIINGSLNLFLGLCYFYFSFSHNVGTGV